MNKQMQMAAVAAWLVMAMSAASAQSSAPVPVEGEQLRDPAQLVAQYEQGRVLAFDLNSREEHEAKKALMSDISGMVVGEQKLVFVKKGPQGSRFLVLEPDVRPAARERALQKFGQDATPRRP